MVKGASYALGLQLIAGDLGIDLGVRAFTDSSATRDRVKDGDLGK